ncbi:MAG TPA: AlkA N-terminal domain-containing protein [Myxococcota bacterium]|nr:AlkA N-terminal domain-containing protein [Myxococcota bacterium]
MGSLELVLAPRGAYSLSRTTARFVRHPDPVNVAGAGGFARLVPAGDGHALVRVTQEGPPTRARLRVRVDGPDDTAARAAAARLAGRVLGADADLRPFERALARDPLLGESVRAHRGLRVAGAFDLFESLVGAVLTQQVNLAFAASIRGELARAFGARARYDGREWLAFPTAERIADAGEARLREFRMTRAKAGTIHRLASAFARGELDESLLAPLDDEAAIAELVRWKGVGRWTAEIVLLRGLGRPDVFPAGDLAVVKHLARRWLGAERVASEAEMRAFSERWRPHRSLALVYGLEELAAPRARQESS